MAGIASKLQPGCSVDIAALPGAAGPIPATVVEVDEASSIAWVKLQHGHTHSVSLTRVSPSGRAQDTERPQAAWANTARAEAAKETPKPNGAVNRTLSCPRCGKVSQNGAGASAHARTCRAREKAGRAVLQRGLAPISKDEPIGEYLARCQEEVALLLQTTAVGALARALGLRSGTLRQWCHHKHIPMPSNRTRSSAKPSPRAETASAPAKEPPGVQPASTPLAPHTVFRYGGTRRTRHAPRPADAPYPGTLSGYWRGYWMAYAQGYREAVLDMLERSGQEHDR